MRRLRIFDLSSASQPPHLKATLPLNDGAECAGHPDEAIGKIVTASQQLNKDGSQYLWQENTDGKASVLESEAAPGVIRGFKPVEDAVVNTVRQKLDRFSESGGVLGRKPGPEARAQMAKAEQELGGQPQGRSSVAPDEAATLRRNVLEQTKNMPPYHQDVANKLAERFIRDPEGAIREYEALPGTDGGRILNADLARDLILPKNDGHLNEGLVGSFEVQRAKIV